MANPLFQPSEALKQFVLNSSKVLIVGAGGLGCEMLKNLSILGLKNIDIIDLDKIDVTNLNRQFLFRKKDIGRFKSEVAAEFITKRIPSCNVNFHVGRIQDKDTLFYSQFQVIIAGLDNIEARRWLNSLIFSFLKYDSQDNIVPSSVKVLIDGGTESFGGQSRVIIPGQTPCFECTIGMIAKANTFNFCTISHIPRIPEHCIAYVYLILWGKEFGQKVMNSDSGQDMKWIFDRAVERALQFGIHGVTYQLTLGVVKNIIPAIASTNAVIAAACSNECLKVLSYIAPTVDNYMMYMGRTGVNISTIKLEKLSNCFVCNNKPQDIEISLDWTVEKFVKKIEKDFNLKKITLNCEDGKYLFASVPQQLYESHKQKLKLTFRELINQSLLNPTVKIYVFAKNLKVEIKLNPKYN